MSNLLDGNETVIVAEVVSDEDAASMQSTRPTKRRRREKQWIDLSNKKHALKGEKIKALVEAAAHSIEDVLHCMNTCLSENSNFRRLTWTRKDRFYVRSYEARSLIEAALENVTREVQFLSRKDLEE